MAKGEKAERVTYNISQRDGMNAALQHIYEKQERGEIDGKTADALNTTVRTSIELNFKLPMKLFDTVAKARMKRVDLPIGILPPWALPGEVLTAQEPPGAE